MHKPVAAGTKYCRMPAAMNDRAILPLNDSTISLPIKWDVYVETALNGSLVSVCSSTVTTRKDSAAGFHGKGKPMSSQKYAAFPALVSLCQYKSIG